jgi:hypothetical protein
LSERTATSTGMYIVIKAACITYVASIYKDMSAGDWRIQACR